MVPVLRNHGDAWVLRDPNRFKLAFHSKLIKWLVMATIMTFRNRVITDQDVTFIRDLIARYPESSRRRLSALLCEAWDWRQPNGRLKDMVCRSLMLKLHREGHIRLPEVRYRTHNPMVQRKRPPKLTEMDETPIECSLKTLGVLEVRVVSGTDDELLFNRLIETYHYLGYTHPVGETMKVMVFSQGRPVACMAWCSGARRLGLRDRHIGWNDDARTRNLSLIVNNTRYLILPWVHVPHLASHLLGRFAREISKQWQDRYGHPVHYLETFVQPDRYAGTCYRAANWISLGMTSGRGANALTSKSTKPPKELLVYPLDRRFRQKMSA